MSRIPLFVGMAFNELEPEMIWWMYVFRKKFGSLTDTKVTHLNEGNFTELIYEAATEIIKERNESFVHGLLVVFYLKSIEARVLSEFGKVSWCTRNILFECAVKVLGDNNFNPPNHILRFPCEVVGLAAIMIIHTYLWAC